MLSLDGLPFLDATMSPESIRLLFQGCPITHKKRQELIFRTGETSSLIWFLMKGRVKLIYHKQDGRVKTMGYHRDGTLIGLINAFSGEPSVCDCEVVADCTLYVCRNHVFLERLVRYNLLEEFLAAEKKNVNRTLLLKANLDSPEELIAALLKENLTQQEIADMLGYSRVQVSRICSKLRSAAECGQQS